MLLGRPNLLARLSVATLAVATAGWAQSAPTLLIVNAKIWTGNPAQPEAEAVAIAGNRIVEVGTTDEILRGKSQDVPKLDLAGRRLLPGFNDAHVHFYAGGSNLTGPQLRYSKSQAEFRDTLGIFAGKQPRGRWITGGNWDHENWTPAQLPTRQLIDSVTADWPVMIKRVDGHMSLANSVALKMAGVDKNTKDVPGGVIVRDAEGNPTGILKDAAQGLVQRVIPPPSESQIIEAVRAAQTYANAQGVTSVQDMSAVSRYFPCVPNHVAQWTASCAHLRSSAVNDLAATCGSGTSRGFRQRVSSHRRVERLCRRFAGLDHGPAF